MWMTSASTPSTSTIRGLGDDCVIAPDIGDYIFSDSDDADRVGRTEQFSDYADDFVFVCVDVLTCRQAGDHCADCC